MPDTTIIHRFHSIEQRIESRATYQTVLQECARINFERVRIFAAVLLAVHSFLLYRDIAVLRVEGYWQRNIGYQHLCTMHVILVVAMIGFLLLSLVLRQDSGERYHWRKTYNITFAAFVLFWCAVMAGWVNQHEHGLITEYIIAIFGIASAFYFSPSQSLLLFSSAQIVFMVSVALILPEPNHSGHYTNTVAMIVIAWVLSRTSFRLTAANITNQEIIHHQTLALEQNNNELKEKNERLEQLDHEKTELMGIVAHDLKNPISAVRGLAEILREEHLPPQMRTNTLQQLSLVNEQMLELVRNLLDINHLDSGTLNWGSESFDILPFVEAIIDRYQDAAARKNITIHPPNKDGNFVVYANEQAMMQVLDNLLSNAVKYSPFGKNVYVRLKSLGREEGHSSLAIGHWSDEKPKAPKTNDQSTNDQSTNDQSTNDQSTTGYVRVEVQDEGEGISPEDMKKLFGKFMRLTARPTGGEHSTGLGLSIVKKMVETMNGRVWCESEVGKGATFIVELPKTPHIFEQSGQKGADR